jgi:hypothetical protein
VEQDRLADRQAHRGRLGADLLELPDTCASRGSASVLLVRTEASLLT